MGQLHILAQYGNIKVIRGALQNKMAFLSLDDDLGWSPLHYASNRSKAKAVQVILDAGISPNIKSKPPKKQKRLFCGIFPTEICQNQRITRNTNL